jgi:hypothetical protein
LRKFANIGKPEAGDEGGFAPALNATRLATVASMLRETRAAGA